MGADYQDGIVTQDEYNSYADNTCIIIDLDGTVADFAASFRTYVYLYAGIRLPEDGLGMVAELAARGGKALADQIEREFFGEKHGFRYLQETKFSQEIAKLSRFGARIFYATCRPVAKYPDILKDTELWLYEHGHTFDRLFFLEHKRGIAEHLKYRWCAERIVAIEDDPTYANELLKDCDQVWMPDQPYNRCMSKVPKITILKDPKELAERMYDIFEQ